MGSHLMKRPPKYVHSFVDRKGRPRNYLRRSGFKKVSLPGLPWSPEFMAAYDEAMKALPKEIGASRTLPGTINALVVSYYKSESWNRLEPDTRKTRRRIIERFRVDNGDKRVAKLERKHIALMLAEIAKASTRRHWFKAIRGLLRSAIPAMRESDPFEGIASIKLPKTKGHHTWTDDEIAKYRAHWKLGTQQRLVMEFALETVSRRGEVVRLGPQHVRDGRIRIERTHGSKDVNIPITAALAQACAAMPKSHLTYIVTAAGKPRSKYGLGNDFAKWVTEASLSKHCRLHGLKKGGMRRGAEKGLTTHELMSISGHRTLSEVQRYTDAADASALAQSAMAKMQGENKTGTSKVANARPQSVKRRLSR